MLLTFYLSFANRAIHKYSLSYCNENVNREQNYK